jgi:hypothetical protein
MDLDLADGQRRRRTVIGARRGRGAQQARRNHHDPQDVIHHP